MRNEEIRIFHTGQMNADREGMQNAIRDSGFSEFKLPGEDQITSTALCAAYPAKMCYQAFGLEVNPNLVSVRDNWLEYFHNILASRHGSVLQHAWHQYTIHGATRVFTAEMNRHTAGQSISEMSLRFVRFDDIPWWLPVSIRPSEWWSDDYVTYTFDHLLNDVLHEEESTTHDRLQNQDVNRIHDITGKPVDEIAYELKKYHTRHAFDSVFNFSEKIYTILIKFIWPDVFTARNFYNKKNITSMLRRIIPMGVSTKAIYTTNMRELRFIMEQRISPSAEEEIMAVLTLIGRDITRREPQIMQDMKSLDGDWFCPEVVRQAILANDKDFCLSAFRKV